MALYTKHHVGQSDSFEPHRMNDTLSSSSSSSLFSSSVFTREWDPSFHGSVHTATIAVCIVLVIFVVILGTFGNGLVLLSALHCRKLRSNFDVLIFNLAGADLIMCSCLSPTFLYLLFSNPPSPKYFCGGFLFSCTACGLLSLLTLVAIAIHRHSRVRKVRGTLTTTKTSLILLAIYVVSFAGAIGGTLHVTLGWEPANLNCHVVLNSENVYRNNVIVFFISPAAIASYVAITVSYLHIAKAVRLQTHLRTKALQPTTKASVSKAFQPNAEERIGSSDVQNTLRYSHISMKRQNGQSPIKHCNCCSCVAALDRENKAVSMCFVVILIITLCWTPLVISHIVELITGESIIIYQVKLCGIALVFLNCALDPYLYAQNSGRIKQKYGRIFWNVLRCECGEPSKRKFPILSPGFMTQRVTRNTLISPDGATLQFLQPTNRKHAIFKPCARLDNKKEKKFPPKCGFKPAPFENDTGLMKSKARPAAVPMKPPAYCDAAIKKQQYNYNQTGVKSLVHKSCCHGKAPDDQSLIDS